MSTQQRSESLVSLRNIDKTFSPDSVSEVVLFSGFSLDISHGQFVTVVGSNGSGKTTLLNIICGNVPADGGSVLLGGVDISQKKEFERARRIGRVFQDPSKGSCPELTILENMALAQNKGACYGLGRGVNRKHVDRFRALLEQLHLGLEDKLDLPVGSLSGGQRQALAMLIATMTPIDLLILDEHTAALDPRSSENVMRLTDQIVKDKALTTLMVTHNLKYAIQYGNRLLMMHQGEVIIDAADERKDALSTNDLLDRFNQISLEVGN